MTLWRPAFSRFAHIKCFKYMPIIFWLINATYNNVYLVSDFFFGFFFFRIITKVAGRGEAFFVSLLSSIQMRLISFQKVLVTQHHNACFLVCRPTHTGVTFVSLFKKNCIQWMPSFPNIFIWDAGSRISFQHQFTDRKKVSERRIPSTEGKKQLLVLQQTPFLHWITAPLSPTGSVKMRGSYFRSGFGLIINAWWTREFL